MGTSIERSAPGAPEAGAAARRRSPQRVAIGLGVGLALLVVLSARQGTTGAYSLAETWRGAAALLGLGDPLPGAAQTIVELRIFRTLVGLGVGAGLALSGALLQGVFRNDLASPGIIGVSAGASLGASLAILALGGYGPVFVADRWAGAAPVFVTACAFLGASGVAFVVTTVASTGGRVSVPTLLLVGLAMNSIAGGLLAAVRSFVLDDYEVARAVYAWSFGTLDDRSGYQVLLVAGGTALAALVIPFVATELDLFAGGEDDARALGVDTARVKIVALVAASLSASVAVAVAGQIAFVGLVVPHVLRLLVERSHRSLLWLCLLAGPFFLLGTDVLQRWALGDAYMKPGVLMSLIGGPFFLYLLVRNRDRIQAW